MREQSCSIPRGLEINKNSAEGEVFFVDFPSYRTLQALAATSGLPVIHQRCCDGTEKSVSLVWKIDDLIFQWHLVLMKNRDRQRKDLDVVSRNPAAKTHSELLQYVRNSLCGENVVLRHKLKVQMRFGRISRIPHQTQYVASLNRSPTMTRREPGCRCA